MHMKVFCMHKYQKYKNSPYYMPNLYVPYFNCFYLSTLLTSLLDGFTRGLFMPFIL